LKTTWNKHMARFVSRSIFCQQKKMAAKGLTVSLKFLSCTLAACLFTITVSVALCRAEEPTPPLQQTMSVVTMLNDDNMGEALRFPSVVAFDQEQEEIYVIIGGKGGFVIYDSDFIPYLFLGAGRGIDAPRSVFFDSREGNLFVCQGKSANRPPRLTILNGAFFPVKEIVFDQIPEADNFSPSRGVLGKRGNIYLVDQNSRSGVLVLDKEGNFLRWIKPQDRISKQETRTTPEPKKESDVKTESVEAPSPSEPPPDTELLDLPPELRPKSRLKAAKSDDGPTQGTVMLNDIITDSDGHLFLLSEETSKVYVYAVNEDFLFSFGEKGGVAGKMSRPKGIAIHEGRKAIYIVDYMRHTILVYDLAGKYLFEFGGRGSGPLWFNFPNSIAVDRKGRVIIADLFNNRVQIVKADFEMSFSGSQKLRTDTPAPATPRERQTVAPSEVTTSDRQNTEPTPETISVPPNNVELENGTTTDKQHLEPQGQKE